MKKLTIILLSVFLCFSSASAVEWDYYFNTKWTYSIFDLGDSFLASTWSGIIKYDKATGEYYRFTEKDGLTFDTMKNARLSENEDGNAEFTYRSTKYEFVDDEWVATEIPANQPFLFGSDTISVYNLLAEKPDTCRWVQFTLRDTSYILAMYPDTTYRYTMTDTLPLNKVYYSGIYLDGDRLWMTTYVDIDNDRIYALVSLESGDSKVWWNSMGDIPDISGTKAAFYKFGDQLWLMGKEEIGYFENGQWIKYSPDAAEPVVESKRVKVKVTEDKLYMLFYGSLSIWDGTSWEVIKFDHLANHNAISFDIISEGHYWISCFSDILEYKDEVFTYVGNNQLPGRSIWGIQKGLNDDIFVFGAGGIAIYNNGNWTKYMQAVTLNTHLPLNPYIDNKGRVWVPGNNDINYETFSGYEIIDGNKITRSDQLGSKSGNASVIKGDKNGDVWVALEDNGFDKWADNDLEEFYLEPDGDYSYRYIDFDFRQNNDMIAVISTLTGQDGYYTTSANIWKLDAETKEWEIFVDKSVEPGINGFFYQVKINSWDEIFIQRDDDVFFIDFNYVMPLDFNFPGEEDSKAVGIDINENDNLIVYIDDLYPSKEGETPGYAILIDGEFEHYESDTDLISAKKDNYGNEWKMTVDGISKVSTTGEETFYPYSEFGLGTPVNLYFDIDNNLWLFMYPGFIRLDAKYTSVPEFSTNSANTNLAISPNPAKDDINISFNLETISEISLRVCDIQGNILFEENSLSYSTGQNETVLSLDGLARGAYYVALIQNGKIIGKANFVKVD